MFPTIRLAFFPQNTNWPVYVPSAVTNSSFWCLNRNGWRKVTRARGATARVVDDVVDDTLEVAVALAKVKAAEPPRSLAVEMFFGGSDTTSSTIEWAMAELLRNPDSMRKVKEEINSVVGLHGKVEEKNMDKLRSLICRQ